MLVLGGPQPQKRDDQEGRVWQVQENSALRGWQLRNAPESSRKAATDKD